MNSTKSRITGILATLLWIFGLLSLNRIVSFATNRSVKKTDIDLVSSKQTVIFNIDSVAFSHNNFNDVTIGGWAFIEDDGDNAYKEISLVFSSDDQSYEFEMITIDRFDLRVAPILKNYIVPISRNGFEGTFSPLFMRNGTYRLYLYIKENESLFGTTDTGRMYTKNFGSFTENVGGEEIRSITDIIDKDITVNTHFLCNIENSYVMVKGWAFVEEGASKYVPSQPVIRMLRPDGSTSYYSTVSLSRVDVAKSFTDDSLLLSGFSSEISTETLGKGDNNFSVIFDGLGESTFSCTVAW